MKTFSFLWISLITAVFIFLPYSTHAEESAKFSLGSGSFLDEGALPVLYTCDGKDVPPQIIFKNIPKKTKYLALIVSDHQDVDKAKFHWIVIDLPGSTQETSEATQKIPSGARLIKNSFDKLDYVGPCPDRGTAHEYFFSGYAYNEPLKSTDAKAIVTELKAKGTETHISGVYSRWF